MKILITGGCGFIGSNLIRFLLNENPDFEIINIDALTYAGNQRNLDDIDNKNYTFYKINLCDKKRVKEIIEFEKPEYIIHLAAETHVDNSIDNPNNFIETNVKGTYNLLESIRQSNIKIKKFLFCSTDEVYGTINNGKFSELSLFLPNSPYSASKASADMLCRSYYVTYNLPIVIFRPSNNYGPFQHPEKLIPKIIKNSIKGIKIPIYGDGKNIREWIFVEDNCRAIYTLLQKGEIGEAYNIGSENEISNIKLTKLIIKKLESNENLIYFVKDRLGHDFRYTLDSSKIKKLGWEPRVDFEEGIIKTINWYKENQKWLEKKN